jgi:rhodanese-related sulfurtransferase
MPITNLTNADLQALLKQEPDLLLLDVRTPEEYFHLGHIPGARLLPIYELPEQLGTLDSQRRTVVICEHGIRSHDAAHYLAHHNFTKVAHLAAGMAEWDGARAYTSEES